MTNHVTPNAEPIEIFNTDGLRAFKRSVGSMDNASYLLVTGSSALLIDAAARGDLLLDWVDGLTLDTVVTTHHHADHIQALAQIVEATGAAAVSGRPDAAAIQTSTGVAQQAVWTGDVVRVGEHDLEVIGLVGHTPGSIALVFQPADGAAHIFTGDSLFPGGVGKTDSPADFESLYHDVVSQIFERFDDDTVIHPGHGDDTTLGVERPQLDQWRARGW